MSLDEDQRNDVRVMIMDYHNDIAYPMHKENIERLSEIKSDLSEIKGGKSSSLWWIGIVFTLITTGVELASKALFK